MKYLSNSRSSLVGKLTLTVRQGCRNVPVRFCSAPALLPAHVTYHYTTSLYKNFDILGHQQLLHYENTKLETLFQHEPFLARSGSTSMPLSKGVPPCKFSSHVLYNVHANTRMAFTIFITTMAVLLVFNSFG